MRVLAVTPTYGGQMRPEMRASMEAQTHDGFELEWMVIDEQPFPAPDHRNVLHMYRKVWRKAVAEGYDALWTVEHDIVLPEQAALHLAATPGDVVYGLYLIGMGTMVLNAFEYVGNDRMGESLSLYPEKVAAARKRGVLRVSGAGWGCTWIRKAALQAITPPDEYKPNPPFDLALAHMAMRLGLRLYMNMMVVCGHIKGGRTLWPFQDGMEPIEHSGFSWPIDGQDIPTYKIVGAPVVATAPPVTVTAATPAVAPVAGMITVVALQNCNVNVNNDSRRIKRGQTYQMPAEAARELARGGYVEVLHAVS